MAEQKFLQEAQITFQTLCQTLEHNEWHYSKDEEKFTIECGARGDDLPMELTVKVDVDRRLVMLFSAIPFVVQEDKRLDAAIAVSAINNMLVDGCFDYNVATGHIFYRMTNSYIESTLSEEVFAYMLYCSCQIIDEYNDKFLMLAKGMISIQQFLASLDN